MTDTAPDHKRFYIGGEWVAPDGSDVIPVLDAATEKVIAELPSGTERDVDTAVSAASTAFASWRHTTRSERAGMLRALADGLERQQEEIAGSIIAEVGTPRRTAERIQATLPVTVMRSYAGFLDVEEEPERIGNTRVFREPIGVVGAIAPWNYPLHQVVAKVAPALAAGCTIVVKPSEVAPLTSWILAQVADEVGLPPGVINVVNGTGPVVGEALATHPGIEAISFTGSPLAGTHVAALAAASVKRVTLELGGKSANVVLDDADLATAVKVGVANAFLNNGQTCTAWTRLVVPRRDLEEACTLAGKFAAAFAPGDPRESSTRLGPMASERHRDSVRAHIAAAESAGVPLIEGGGHPPADLDQGYFIRPTVFGDVDPDSAIAQDEVFGPVLCVIGHDGDDDAVEIANNSRYGLHGAVWSADQDRALSVARAMRTGTVDINGAAYNPLAPFGGVKQSGYGREMGAHGLDEFLELKAVQE